MKEINSILNLKGLEIVDFSFEKIGVTGTEAEREQAVTVFESTVVNKKIGRPYYDGFHNVLKYYDGTNWVKVGEGAEGALVPKGTIDATLANDGSEDTDNHKRQLPSVAKGGDTWFVATTGEYTFYNGTSTVTATLKPADFLFCVNDDSTIVWSLVEAGEGFLTSQFSYSSSSPSTTSWTIPNTLKSIDINVDVYKLGTMTEGGTSNVPTREKVLCDITFTANNIYINFGRPLIDGETYIVVGTSN